MIFLKTGKFLMLFYVITFSTACETLERLKEATNARGREHNEMQKIQSEQRENASMPGASIEDFKSAFDTYKSEFDENYTYLYANTSEGPYKFVFSNNKLIKKEFDDKTNAEMSFKKEKRKRDVADALQKTVDGFYSKPNNTNQTNPLPEVKIDQTQLKQTDFKCKQDCQNLGYSWSLCEKKCSY